MIRAVRPAPGARSDVLRARTPAPAPVGDRAVTPASVEPRASRARRHRPARAPAQRRTRTTPPPPRTAGTGPPETRRGHARSERPGSPSCSRKRNGRQLAPGLTALDLRLPETVSAKHPRPTAWRRFERALDQLKYAGATSPGPTRGVPLRLVPWLASGRRRASPGPSPAVAFLDTHHPAAIISVSGRS